MLHSTNRKSERFHPLPHSSQLQQSHVQLSWEQHKKISKTYSREHRGPYRKHEACPVKRQRTQDKNLYEITLVQFCFSCDDLLQCNNYKPFHIDCGLFLFPPKTVYISQIQDDFLSKEVFSCQFLLQLKLLTWRSKSQPIVPLYLNCSYKLFITQYHVPFIFFLICTAISQYIMKYRNSRSE